jgi:hypothetical protein
MKIVDVRCIPVANPEQERNYLFVKVETDEGKRVWAGRCLPGQPAPSRALLGGARSAG